MKNFNKLICLIFLSVSLSTACKKGEQGLVGEKGESGNAILSGTNAPDASIGNVGDYYFDKTTTDFYGPKTDEGWTDYVRLAGPDGQPGPTGPQGPTGSQGVAGSQILNGNNTPHTAIGNIGDYYLQPLTSRLFGPKTSNGWGAGILLRGAQGPKGDKGDPGNANVIYSDWKFLTWNVFSSTTVSAIMTAPELTQYDNGDNIVMVYRRSGVIRQLPYSFFSNENASLHCDFDYTLGSNKININTRKIGSPLVAQIDYDYMYRYVIIPRGVLASSQAKGVNLKNFAELAQSFDIPQE